MKSENSLPWKECGNVSERKITNKSGRENNEFGKGKNTAHEKRQKTISGP